MPTDKQKEYNRKWYLANKEKVKGRTKAWQGANREKYLKYLKDWHVEAKKDPAFREKVRV